MTIHLTANAMRRAADVLDQLDKLEFDTGIRVDGGHYGYVLLSISDERDPDAVTESLRLVRLPASQPSPQVIVPAAYAFEFEVP